MVARGRHRRTHARRDAGVYMRRFSQREFCELHFFSPLVLSFAPSFPFGPLSFCTPQNERFMEAEQSRGAELTAP